MDLQDLCDQYSCVAYIVAYVTKDKKVISTTLKNGANEMRNPDVKTRLKHIGHVFLRKREISAQEAAHKIIGLPLKRCITKIIWISTNSKQNKYLYFQVKKCMYIKKP